MCSCTAGVVCVFAHRAWCVCLHRVRGVVCAAVAVAIFVTLAFVLNQVEHCAISKAAHHAPLAVRRSCRAEEHSKAK